MNFMRSSFLVALFCFIMSLIAHGQIDPTRDLNWPRIDISGTDTPIQVCSTTNYGQPFQRTDVTPNKWGTCGADGWQYRGSTCGNCAVTNGANTFTEGQQTIQTGDSTHFGVLIKGTAGSVTAGSYVSSAVFTSPATCRGTSTYTLGAGHAVIVFQDGSTTSSTNVPALSTGETATHIWTNPVGSNEIQDGYEFTNIVGGSVTITWNSGYDCGYLELASAAGLDGSPVYNTGVSSSTTGNVAGPITTTQANDLILTFADNLVSQPGPPSGFTSIPNMFCTGNDCGAYEVASTVGTYSATWIANSGNTGRSISYVTIALKGVAGTQQTANPLEYDLPSGTDGFHVDGAGNVYTGTNTLYRCTTAGTLPVGALTTVQSDCGASVDTGFRTN